MGMIDEFSTGVERLGGWIEFNPPRAVFVLVVFVLLTSAICETCVEKNMPQASPLPTQLCPWCGGLVQ